MRLICPNCRTEYEVADAAIPPKGREVQCGACNQSWFQPGIASPRATDADAPEASSVAPEETVETESEAEQTSARPGDVPQEEALAKVSQGVREAVADFSNAPDEDPTLQERMDAAYDAPDDTQERAAQRSAVLGAVSALGAGAAATAAAPRGSLAERLMARSQSEDAPDAGDNPTSQILGASSEALDRATIDEDDLPDADQLASSLDPVEMSKDRAAEAALTSAMARRERTETKRKSRAFQRGFALALLLLALALIAYLAAPALSRAVPDLAPYLDQYTARVDDGRAWLAELVSRR